MSLRTIARWRWVYLAWVLPIVGFIGLTVIEDWAHASVMEVALRLKADPPKSLQEIQRILEGHPYIVGPEYKSTLAVGADERRFKFKPNTFLRVAYTPRQKLVVGYEILYQMSEPVDLDDIERTCPPDVNWPLTIFGIAAVLAGWVAAWELANRFSRKEAKSLRILGYGIALLCITVLAFGYMYASVFALYFPAI